MSRTAIPAEKLALGMVVNDERYSCVIEVGHITVGPKWVTVRAFHPEANVWPKSAQRFQRGSTVTVHSDVACRFCGQNVRWNGDSWVDELGESCCETHVEGCSACDDGESHPHEP